MKYDLSNEPVAVLDACALIALLNDEQGADVVAQALETIPVVRISSVNLLEVAYDAVRKTGRQEAAREIIDDVRKLGVTVDFAVSEEMIPAASVIKTSFRISLADAIALALAATHRAPVITSDRAEFGPVEEDRAARFIWIR